MLLILILVICDRKAAIYALFACTLNMIICNFTFKNWYKHTKARESLENYQQIFYQEIGPNNVHSWKEAQMLLV